jgi:DNA-binding transcriptional LysR family regulator
MRAAACAALEQANLAWRQAFSSSSLSGIWAAVAAGLGVTVRTPVGVPDTLQLRQDLPALPGIRLMLYRAESTATVGCQRLSDIVNQALQDYLHGLRAA